MMSETRTMEQRIIRIRRNKDVVSGKDSADTS